MGLYGLYLINQQCGTINMKKSKNRKLKQWFVQGYVNIEYSVYNMFVYAKTAEKARKKVLKNLDKYGTNQGIQQHNLDITEEE